MGVSPCSPPDSRSPRSVAVVGTYPPTRCGIATFSAALVGALREQDPGLSVGVLALGDARRRPDRGDVIGTLLTGHQRALDRAASALRTFDHVIVQHEYGIYPGHDGAAVIDLLARLDRSGPPVTTVLHTVLEHPSPSQQWVLEQVVAASSAVVVMADVARRRLVTRYAVDAAKVHVIPHGSWVPLDVVADRPDGRPTLLTWGLLGPGKGIEVAIDALAELDPRVRPRYVVAGQTHPKVRERHGEAYRDMLVARARKRGVGDLVEFDDRYLDQHALTALIRSADAVVLPYESVEQVTSGVLVDAVACGRPVVASAFPHAVELLGRGAGITVPHGDVEALAAALRAVLDPAVAARLRDAAGAIAPELSWNAVARRYVQLAATLGRGRGVRPGRRATVASATPS